MLTNAFPTFWKSGHSGSRTFNPNTDKARAVRSRLREYKRLIFILALVLALFSSVFLFRHLFKLFTPPPTSDLGSNWSLALTPGDLRAVRIDPASLALHEGRVTAIKKLAKAPRNVRVRLLRDALVRWSSGPMPADVAVVAAASAPHDVVSAVLGLTEGSFPVVRRDRAVVLDVGANQGWPVTRFALERGIGYVVSLEPDPRNFKVLSKLTARKKFNGTSFKPLHCAAGRVKSRSKMSFHKKRNDFSCFGCLDPRKKSEVYEQEVDVVSVDSLFAEKAGIPKNIPVLLFKTDTQGYEAEVLHGAETLLRGKRVEHVMVEFDPRLLRTDEAALDVLTTLSNAGLNCVHLAFSGRGKFVGNGTAAESLPGGANPLYFQSGRFDSRTGLDFIRFVEDAGGWTDLFCVRRRSSETL